MPEQTQYRRAKVMGERCTATNAVAQRIEGYQHATGLATFGGWKHACLTDRLAALKDVLFVCVLRHAARWALSMYELRCSTYLTIPHTLDGFPAQPCITRPRDEVAELVLDGPAVLWRLKTKSCLNQVAHRADEITIRHEDFMHEYLSVPENLRNHLAVKDNTRGLVTSYRRNLQDEGPDLWQIHAALPEDPWTVTSSDAARILRTRTGAKLLQRAGYTP